MLLAVYFATCLLPSSREDFTPSLPLGLKGRFYASLHILYLTGRFYARKVGVYAPCVYKQGSPHNGEILRQLNQQM